MINQESNSFNFSPFIDLFVLLYLIGLVSSKALLSIGMIGLVSVSLVAAISRPQIKKDIWLFLFPVIIFMITLASGINSENTSTWLTYLLKKLPFLILPFTFYFLQDHISKRYYHYLGGFVSILCICSIYILLKYVVDFEVMQAAISKGKAISTPIDHSEFSLFSAFGALASILLYFNWPGVLRRKYKLTMGIMAIFLSLFIHILAVRSGLVIFYASLFIIGTHHFIQKKKFKSLVILLAAIITIPFIGRNLIPSLKAKMDYVKYDLTQFKKGKGLNYSDSERIYSLKAGFKIFENNKLFGVGIGDLKDACINEYQKQNDFTINHYPHNQYLFALAGLGAIGLIFYLISLFGPIWVFRSNANYYFIGLHLVIFISALVENTIERTFSIGFYLFFVLATICYLNSKWKYRTY